MIIHPTGTCFDDALDFICDRVQCDPMLAHAMTLVLVHGIIQPEEGGDRCSHGWCEEAVDEQWFVWASGLVDGKKVYYMVPRELYYEKLHIVRTTSYTIREAYEENVRTNNYGPWDPEYITLAKPRGE